MTPGAEPIGCPTPGACSCPRAALTAPAVQAALEQLRDAVTIFAPDVDLRADLLAKLAIVATACEQAESRAARLDQCIADGQRMAGYLEAAEQRAEQLREDDALAFAEVGRLLARAEQAEAQAEELRAVVLEKSHRCLELAQRVEQTEAREGAHLAELLWAQREFNQFTLRSEDGAIYERARQAVARLSRYRQALAPAPPDAGGAA